MIHAFLQVFTHTGTFLFHFYVKRKESYLIPSNISLNTNTFILSCKHNTINTQYLSDCIYTQYLTDFIYSIFVQCLLAWVASYHMKNMYHICKQPWHIKLGLGARKVHSLNQVISFVALVRSNYPKYALYTPHHHHNLFISSSTKRSSICHLPPPWPLPFPPTPHIAKKKTN